MTLDQLSNLVKDPKLFGILIVRPFGLLLQWLYSIVQNYGIAVILVRAAGKAGLHPADHQEQEEYARHERDERRAPAAAEEVREQPRQAERRDAEAV